MNNIEKVVLLTLALLMAFESGEFNANRKAKSRTKESRTTYARPSFSGRWIF